MLEQRLKSFNVVPGSAEVVLDDGSGLAGLLLLGLTSRTRPIRTAAIP